MMGLDKADAEGGRKRVNARTSEELSWWGWLSGGQKHSSALLEREMVAVML